MNRGRGKGGNESSSNSRALFGAWGMGSFRTHGFDEIGAATGSETHSGGPFGAAVSAMMSGLAGAGTGVGSFSTAFGAERLSSRFDSLRYFMYSLIDR